MPQASGELRKRMKERFGHSVSEAGPTEFLKDAGYELQRGFVWKPKPGVASVEEMARDEFECLMFLVHEWDYGGLIESVD